MSERFAVLDLGSNSFRLEIGSFCGGKLVPVQYMKEPVRLAAGFNANGAINRATLDRSIEALRRFGAALEGIPRENIRAVGTQALRIAKNSEAFLSKAEAVLGFPVSIITGSEEARLTYKGCIRTLSDQSCQRRLVIDIGGASTELSVGMGDKIEETASFPLGCVNASIRYFPGGAISPDLMQRSIEDAASVFSEGADRFSAEHWSAAYGSAGTISAICSVSHAEGWGNGPITPDILRHALCSVSNAGHVSRIALRGLKNDRKDIIAGGLSVLAGLFRALRIPALGIASGSLRAGIFYELYSRENQGF